MIVRTFDYRIIRVTLLTILAGLLFLVGAEGYAYQWPMKDKYGKFNTAHPIAGVLGEFRLAEGIHPIHLHMGVDMPATAGTPVYPVVSGNVSAVGSETVIVLGDDGKYYSYIHITPSVFEGRVVAGTNTLGSIKSSIIPPPHLHFQVVTMGTSDGPYSNPLLSGLSPYDDINKTTVFHINSSPASPFDFYTTSKTKITSVDSSSRPLLAGNIDIVARAKDAQSNGGSPTVAPYRVCYNIMNQSKTSTVRGDTCIVFDQLPSHTAAIRPEYVYDIDRSNNSTYSYHVTNKITMYDYFDTTSLANGIYQLTVFADDIIGGNYNIESQIGAETVEIAIQNSVPVSLKSFKVAGPTIVNENSSAQYTCTATMSDSSTTNCTNSINFSWSEGCANATISSPGGFLTTTTVSADEQCFVSATYMGGAWPSSSMGITIKNTTDPIETVSTPSTPSGQASGNILTSYGYSTGGAASSQGHAVEYRFDWGNGSFSSWTSSSGAANGWTAAGSYAVKAQARCATHTTVVSGWSSAFTVTINAPTETVSTPSTPSGVASGSTNTSYGYTTGGAASSQSHAVEYRFDWGNGSFSSWSSSSSAAYGWTAAGSYAVKAQARCATHTTVVSGWSSAFNVTISSASTAMLAIYDGSIDDTYNFVTAFKTAQAFRIAANTVITGFSFRGSKGNSSLGSTWSAEIWEGGASPTDGTLKKRQTFNTSTLSSYSVSPTFQDHEFSTNTGILTGGTTTYYFVIYPNNGDLYDELRWSLDTTSPSYDDGSSWSFSDGTWAEYAAHDRNFKIFGYSNEEPLPSYVLWTNGGAGQAILWKIDPDTGAWTNWSWISPPSGVGAGWQASSYTSLSATTGYVLWTNSSLGQASLWKTNPDTGGWSSWSWISPPTGVGAGWQASSYAHVSATTRYVLWTNSSAGQAIRWKIDPGTGAMTGWGWISPTTGVGGGWQATSY